MARLALCVLAMLVPIAYGTRIVDFQAIAQQAASAAAGAASQMLVVEAAVAQRVWEQASAAFDGAARDQRAALEAQQQADYAYNANGIYGPASWTADGDDHYSYYDDYLEGEDADYEEEADLLDVYDENAVDYDTWVDLEGWDAMMGEAPYMGPAAPSDLEAEVKVDAALLDSLYEDSASAADIRGLHTFNHGLGQEDPVWLSADGHDTSPVEADDSAAWPFTEPAVPSAASWKEQAEEARDALLEEAAEITAWITQQDAASALARGQQQQEQPWFEQEVAAEAQGAAGVEAGFVVLPGDLPIAYDTNGRLMPALDGLELGLADWPTVRLPDGSLNYRLLAMCLLVGAALSSLAALVLTWLEMRDAERAAAAAADEESLAPLLAGYQAPPKVYTYTKVSVNPAHQQV